MKKSEMNESQLRDRTLFVDTLSRAGWQGTLFNEQFDEGLWTAPEASLEFSSKAMQMRFDFEAEDPRVILYLDSPEGRSLGLVFRCIDRLAPLLKAVIAVQDTINAANIKRKSEEFLSACPNVFKISASGDKEIPVKPARSR